tara:strand:- start:825 stop:1061 length:237 start_codon:yes stop_codon:yes gene_type:complete
MKVKSYHQQELKPSTNLENNLRTTQLMGNSNLYFKENLKNFSSQKNRRVKKGLLENLKDGTLKKNQIKPLKELIPLNR